MINDFSILYVEDDSLSQQIVLSVLKRYFKKIYIARDGLDGLERYYETKPDIVLSDISMPNLDGIAMISEIKKTNPKQKIIFFTSYNELNYLNKAINFGVDKYILKPLHTQKMLSVLLDMMHVIKKERQEVAYRRKLEFISQHDELTGLLNRRQFFFLLEKLLLKSNKEEKRVAVLALDLNKFKAINDTYGHEAGDLVLKRVAKNLIKATRKEDIVARFGGDEFAIAIGFLKEKNKLLSLLEKISNSFNVPLIYIDQDGIKHTIDIACSIGITFHMMHYEMPPLETLMQEADRAMYTAKLLKKPYAFFSEAEASKFKIKMQKREAVKEGMIYGEFMMYYQPIIDIKTHKIVAYEALIRWQHPTEGLLSAEAFLPYILDDVELMRSLGKWIIEEVFYQYVLWLEEGMDIPLSINVSYNELLSSNFIALLEKLLTKYPSVKAKQIIFEIGENVILKEIELGEKVLNTLKDLGFKIALDSFGTEASALSSVKCFNIDSIKIDKSFVIGMVKSEEDYSIVDASIKLAKAFGHVVIAEGVESREHLALLRKLGCDRVQGFVIAKPSCADKVMKNRV